MAPELFRGAAPAPSADVYALGVTLYQVATGCLPRAIPVAGRRSAAWNPAPRPPSALRPDRGSFTAAALDAVVLRCLALDPALRFPSAVEVAEALDRAAGGDGPEAPPPPAAVRTIGRDEELREVDRFLDGIRPSSPEAPGPGPAALLIAGPPGCGRTHFFREIKVRAQTRGFSLFLESGYPGRATAPGSLLRCLTAAADGPARRRFESFVARLRKPRRPARDEPLEGDRRLRWAAEVRLAALEVRAPTVIAVDGLEHFDEVSVALVSDLVRLLGGMAAGERPPLGVILGYREEGPSRALIEELTETIARQGTGVVVPLRSLGPRESRELYAACGGEETEATRGLSLFQETGGLPKRIVEKAREGREDLPSRSTTAPGTRGLPRRGSEDAKFLLALEALRRPAGIAELAAALRLPSARVARCAARLAGIGLALREEPEDPAAPARWVLAPGVGSIAARTNTREGRAIHLRIALRLSRTGAADAAKAVEAVRHFEAAGRRGDVVRLGRQIARHLDATFQTRAALEVHRRVLAALPVRSAAARLAVALEISDLQARIGELDEAIRLLQEASAASRSMPLRWRARVILRLAVLHARRGDLRRAHALFREGFRTARGARPPLPLEERLLFLDEHAGLKVFLGEHQEALALCEEGLRSAGRRGGPRMREAALNLLATRGIAALRSFDFDEAARRYEEALEAAEATGSLANQAVILNNLGIAYHQADRFAEAIRVFRDAERICLRIDEGPSLAFIHGNLAVLHAKTGDFEAAGRAIREAAGLGGRGAPGSPAGLRQELFLEHHAGIALIYEGRHAAARPRFEAALRLGSEVGDRTLAAFDRVYRAECLVFEAAYGDAERELRAIAEGEAPAVVRRMALSRLAFALAITGRKSDAEEVGRSHGRLDAGRAVPFLDAWDRLFLGWAASIAGQETRGREVLEPAERYFRAKGLRPAESLAVWIRAESHFLEGDPVKAREAIAGREGEWIGLAAVLRPLLEARLLLGDGHAPADRARAADLLAAAGTFLLGTSLPEWSLRLDAIRASLLGGGEGAGAREDPRAACRESAHWKAWAPPPAGERARDRRRSGRRRDRRPPPSLATPGTRTAEIGRPVPDPRRAIVARSPGMRELLAVLDRLRASDLPVVIAGETGSGKELVARTIHAESRRRGRPFVVIDPAAIPASLLESELFGARAGAFTDLRKDRPGLLARADGGTALIDEIAGLPLEVQAKLLRAVSEGAFRPVGGDSEVRLDVRFLFTTSRDLDAEVREGRLRGDLFHRISVISVRVPPLRERSEDLPDLIRLFLAEGTGVPPALEDGFIRGLRDLCWPGNVRELRNLILRLRLEHPRRIPLSALPEGGSEGGARSPLFPGHLLEGRPLAEIRETLERDYILHHLERLRGDAMALSRFLGVSRKHLYRRLGRLGIALKEAKRRPRKR